MHLYGRVSEYTVVYIQIYAVPGPVSVLATLSGIVWPGNLYSCGFIVDPLVTFEFFSLFFF